MFSYQTENIGTYKVGCIWNVMAHAQKPDFVLLRLKCDGTCAETRFRLTAFEMWWHMRRNQISSYCVWNVMTHAQKPDFVFLCLKCDGTRAETRFRLTAFEMWWHMRRNQISSCCFWNVMAHAQKPDFIFRWNGLVHLNRQGRQFSRLLGAEVCASAVVMLDTPCSEVVWRVLATHSILQFLLHFLSRASLCAITFQLDSSNYRNDGVSIQFVVDKRFCYIVLVIRNAPKYQARTYDCQKRLVASSCPSVRPSAWNNSTPHRTYFHEIRCLHISRICRENSSHITIWQQ